MRECHNRQERVWTGAPSLCALDLLEAEAARHAHDSRYCETVLVLDSVHRAPNCSVFRPAALTLPASQGQVYLGVKVLILNLCACLSL